MALPSALGEAVDAAYLGAARTYNIMNGKIVTALVGTVAACSPRGAHMTNRGRRT